MPAQTLPAPRQTAPLLVSHPQSSATELSPQSSILFDQIGNDILLLVIEPTRQRSEKDANSTLVKHGASLRRRPSVWPLRALFGEHVGQLRDRVAIDGVSFEIAFQRLAVNGDALDDRGPSSRDDVGHVGLDLRDSRERSDRRGESCGQNGHASY